LWKHFVEYNRTRFILSLDKCHRYDIRDSSFIVIAICPASIILHSSIVHLCLDFPLLLIKLGKHTFFYSFLLNVTRLLLWLTYMRLIVCVLVRDLKDHKFFSQWKFLLCFWTTRHHEVCAWCDFELSSFCLLYQLICWNYKCIFKFKLWAVFILRRNFINIFFDTRFSNKRILFDLTNHSDPNAIKTLLESTNDL